MNRIIREFDGDHPGVRQKVSKALTKELKLYIKIGFPSDITNFSNLLTRRLIKIIIEE